MVWTTPLVAEHELELAGQVAQVAELVK